MIEALTLSQSSALSATQSSYLQQCLKYCNSLSINMTIFDLNTNHLSLLLINSVFSNLRLLTINTVAISNLSLLLHTISLNKERFSRLNNLSLSTHPNTDSISFGALKLLPGLNKLRLSGLLLDLQSLATILSIPSLIHCDLGHCVAILYHQTVSNIIQNHKNNLKFLSLPRDDTDDTLAELGEDLCKSLCKTQADSLYYLSLHSRLSIIAINPLLAAISSLRILDLNGSIFPNPVVLFRSLTLINNNDDNNNRYHSNLETLIIDRVLFDDDDYYDANNEIDSETLKNSLNSFLDFYSTLKCFSICWPHIAFDSFIPHLASMNSLTNLLIRGSGGFLPLITMKTVLLLINHKLNLLHTLTLINLPLTDGSLIILLQSMPELKDFKLSQCHEISSIILLILRSFNIKLLRFRLNVEDKRAFSLTSAALITANISFQQMIKYCNFNPILYNSFPSLIILEFQARHGGLITDEEGMKRLIEILGASQSQIQYLSLHIQSLNNEKILQLRSLPKLISLSLPPFPIEPCGIARALYDYNGEEDNDNSSTNSNNNKKLIKLKSLSQKTFSSFSSIKSKFLLLNKKLTTKIFTEINTFDDQQLQLLEYSLFYSNHSSMINELIPSLSLIQNENSFYWLYSRKFITNEIRQEYFVLLEKELKQQSKTNDLNSSSSSSTSNNKSKPRSWRRDGLTKKSLLACFSPSDVNIN